MQSGGENGLLHQQHLARALDGEGQTALVMRGHPGVFARQDAALVRHILPEQIGVFVIERIGGKVNLRLRTGRAFFRLAATRTAAPRASPRGGRRRTPGRARLSRTPRAPRRCGARSGSPRCRRSVSRSRPVLPSPSVGVRPSVSVGIGDVSLSIAQLRETSITWLDWPA